MNTMDTIRAADPAAVLSMTADVVLIMESDGTILEANCRLDHQEGLADEWVGRTFRDIVTSESMAKVDALLNDARARAPRWRQVNHPRASTLIDYPIRYCTLAIGDSPHVLVLGQDLLPRAELQQQLVDTQQAAEQDYWRLQHAEARFQLLFDASPDPVFMTNAEGSPLMEANPAAAMLVKAANASGAHAITRLFHQDDVARIKALFAHTRAIGYSEEAGVRMADGVRAVTVSCSLHRHKDAPVLITKLRLGDKAPASEPSAVSALRLLENLPEAAVLLDAQHNIQWANQAFAQVVQCSRTEQVLNTEMGAWLGRSAVDLNVLAANVRSTGNVSAFHTTIQGQLGLRTSIEVSAAAIGETAQALGGQTRAIGMGLILRRQRQHHAPAPRTNSLDAAQDRISDLVGRLSLKELVRESAEEIERLAINASLKLTENNRAAAAEMLGISRQSLYVKLRRFSEPEGAEQ